MEVALMTLGLFVFSVLLMWIYTHLNDSKEINEEEGAEVRAETPQERERERFDIKERVEGTHEAHAGLYSSNGSSDSESGSDSSGS